MLSLIADVGGTTTRFALARDGGRPQDIAVVHNDDVPDLETAIERDLAKREAKPHNAVLAVAGPIEGRDIAMTNRAWRFNLDALSKQLGFQVHALNDFEAIAWALPELTPSDMRPIGAARAAGGGPKVAVGPGTGIGVGALTPVANGWHAIASEGGHVSFGPAHPDEFDIFAKVAKDGGLGCAESVVSGAGLERIFRAVSASERSLEDHDIVARAAEGDAQAKTAVGYFVRFLGRFAGDMALAFKATGGVYIAGGITPKLGALFDQEVFRSAFEAHAPYQALMESIPTSLITLDQPGLLGCAAVAGRMKA